MTGSTHASRRYARYCSPLRNYAKGIGSCIRVLGALVVLGSLTCSPKPGGQSRGPFVIMIAGKLAKEGSFEDCVYQKMQGGMQLADAIKDCAELVPPDLSGTGLDPLDLMEEGTGVQASDCYDDWNSNAPLAGSPEFERAKELYLDYLTANNLLGLLRAQVANERNPGRKSDLQLMADQQRRVRNQAVEQYQDASKALTDEERVRFKMFQDLMWGDVEGASKPGDYPLPDPDAPTPARPIPDSVSLCQQVAEFVGECNRDGWRNPDCKTFLDKLNGCLDRTVADPADPGEPCSIPPVDPETAREVVLLHCWGLRKPVPGEDPCSKTISGEAFEYYLRTGAGGLDPCNDPHVRHTGEDCYPTFTLVKFGEVDVRELAKWGLDKLGGPVFVIPIGPPDPGTEPPPPID